jgi:hypothetical protein
MAFDFYGMLKNKTVILTEGQSYNFYRKSLTSATSITSQVSAPSAMKIVEPMLTLFGRLL